MSGEYSIAAPRETVWAALNDPQVLHQSIPGCEKIERLSDTEFKAAIVVSVGPISGKFRSKFNLADLEPPSSYTLAGQGTGAMGFASWQAKVALSDVNGDTTLTYELKADVSGRIAQMSAGLVDSITRQMADQFFARFSELVNPEGPRTVISGSKPAFQATTAQLTKLILITGVAVIAILAYVLITG